MTKESGFVKLYTKDRIAFVTIDNPPVNSLNRFIENEIGDIFNKLEHMSEVGVVIITGTGDKSFIAGADIKSILKKSPRDAREMSVSTQEVLLKIDSLNKVVIAAVNGLALGGGCEVALACDIRVADETAIFGFPEVCLGLIPGAGGTQRLSRLVGIGKAKEMIFTGDPIKATEAQRIGLVERIAPKGEAVAVAKIIANRILLRGPIAVVSAKKAINEGMSLQLEKGFERETELFSALFQTKDMREGVIAFLDKRKPTFLGE